MSLDEIGTLGKKQESIGRLRLVVESGETDAIGSVSVINPSGLCITAKHNVEEYLTPKKCPCCDEMIPPPTLEVDIPVIKDGVDSIELMSFKAQVLGLSSYSDLALLSLKRKEDEPFEFLHLESENPRHASNAYKIGHLNSNACNLLSAGKVVNNRTSIDIGTIPSGEIVIVTTAPCGGGDSGGALVGDDLKLRGLLTNVIRSIRGTDSDFSVFAEEVGVGKRAQSHAKEAKVFSIGVSVKHEVLPALEDVLNKKTFTRMLDGREVILSKREEKRVKEIKW